MHLIFIENNEGPPASSLHIVRVLCTYILSKYYRKSPIILAPPSYPFIHESNQLKQLDFLEGIFGQKNVET